MSYLHTKTFSFSIRLLIPSTSLDIHVFNEIYGSTVCNQKRDSLKFSAFR